MKKIFILSLMTVSLFAGGEIKEEKSVFMDNHFLYLSGGLTNNNIDNKLFPGDTFKKGALDDKGSIFELGVGYQFNKNLFSTVFYQREDLDIVSKDNALISLNYQFSDLFLKPYIGAITGYSHLTWDEAPYDLQRDNKFDSDSFVYGGQVGVEYFFTEKVSFFTKYELLFTDHKMDILEDRNTIEHNNVQNVQIGVRYEF